MCTKNNYFKFLLVSILLLFSKFSYAQTEADFIGDWKIIKVDMLPSAGQEEKQMFQKVRSIFSKSTFHFKSNNLFSFDSPDIDLSIKDGIWNFDAKNRYITISERMSKGTRDLLMGIYVKETIGGFLFYMEETSVILMVTRKN